MKKEEYKLKDIFENQILNELYESSRDGFECIYIKTFGEPQEIRETKNAKEDIEQLIEKIIPDKEKQKELWLKLDKYDGCMSLEMEFWHRQFYKLGVLDKNYLKKEMEELEEKFAKSNNSELESSFFYSYIDSFMEFIEDNRFGSWKKRADYKKINDRMIEIKNKYPNIRTFVEDRQVIKLSKEELSALLEYISLDDCIERIEKIETFKLGIKEGNML